MNQFKRRLAGFHVAAAFATLLCVTAQPAKADNLNNSKCNVTFTVAHPDTTGRPGEYVTQLLYTPPPGFKFIDHTFAKVNQGGVNYKQQIDASGNLVLSMPGPPNQFPTSSTSPSSFQFQIGLSSNTLSCNYGTQDLQGMLVTTSLSDGFTTASRFLRDSSGNVTGGTGTPAADIPATIDPTKFTQVAGALPCSPGTQTLADGSQKLTNGCPDPAKVGAADGDPSYEGGQLGGSAANRSCTPVGSLSALLHTPASNWNTAAPTSVTAYVPNGAWNTSAPGVRVVTIEPAPGGPLDLIATPNTVNSCASNSQTGQTVCTANGTVISETGTIIDKSVYLMMSGTSLISTLQSGATASARFSGGSCVNCGVAINQITNTAVLGIGLSSAASGTGLQFLDLGSTPTFSSVVSAANTISEGLVWDPTRNLILSPNEGTPFNFFNAPPPTGNGVYDLFDTSGLYSSPGSFSSPLSVSEYDNPVYTLSPGGGAGSTYLDSAAEDCSTGIALASNETKSNVYIADLTRATTNGEGNWTAPQQFFSLPEFSGFSFEISGLAAAPGPDPTGLHLAVVTGEFGGNRFGVLELPATSGTGTPGLADYVTAFLPNAPDGPWSEGLDPHPVTAYISPNDGKAYALLANAPFCSTSGSYLPPTYVAVIDMAALLAPNIRSAPGAHTLAAGADNSNLLSSGIVRYIATGNVSCPPPPSSPG